MLCYTREDNIWRKWLCRVLLIKTSISWPVRAMWGLLWAHSLIHTIISMVLSKTTVYPLLTHWRYCSLALNHMYVVLCNSRSCYQEVPLWYTSSLSRPNLQGKKTLNETSNGIYVERYTFSNKEMWPWIHGLRANDCNYSKHFILYIT